MERTPEARSSPGREEEGGGERAVGEPRCVLKGAVAALGMSWVLRQEKENKWGLRVTLGFWSLEPGGREPGSVAHEVGKAEPGPGRRGSHIKSSVSDMYSLRPPVEMGTEGVGERESAYTRL